LRGIYLQRQNATVQTLLIAKKIPIHQYRGPDVLHLHLLPARILSKQKRPRGSGGSLNRIFGSGGSSKRIFCSGGSSKRIFATCVSGGSCGGSYESYPSGFVLFLVGREGWFHCD
jgi:hypothetical protein